MKDNVKNISRINECRPRSEYKYSDNIINSKIDRETKLAIHAVKIFCIKNILWIVPIILGIIIILGIDIWIVLGIWKNPTILFNQSKIICGLILSYIAGLYTDEMRRKFTKH